jgi:DNA-binding MarR family transcriptional regulator
MHLLNKTSDAQSQKTYFQKVGLSLSEARCLATVGSFPKMSVMDLAEKGNLNKGQASRAAQILVDKGLISKKENPDDGRGVTLDLTPQGKKVWEKTMAQIQERNQQIVACLSNEEQHMLSGLLDRLLEHNVGK